MNPIDKLLREQLDYLKLPFLAENYAALATEAAQKQGSPVDYLARLIDGETQRRKELSIQRRVAAARFPVLKTLESFDFKAQPSVNPNIAYFAAFCWIKPLKIQGFIRVLCNWPKAIISEFRWRRFFA